VTARSGAWSAATRRPCWSIVPAILLPIFLLAAPAAAHEQQRDLIPPVAICNPDAYGGITWRWVDCNHDLHGHSQWRHGRGTAGHTVHAYRREARQIRNYLIAL
jgi:hypothetical protein